MSVGIDLAGRGEKISSVTETVQGWLGSIIPFIVIVSILAGVGLVLVITDWNVLAALAFALAVTVLLATFYKSEWGFFIFFGMVLLFDQYLNELPLGVPVTAQVGYFLNLKQNPLLPSFAAGVVNPIELQLGLIILAWFISVISRKSHKLVGIPYWGFALLLLVTIGGSLLHGLSTGGEFLPALWEIRALTYFLIVYFLVPQMIQTRTQLNIVLWIIVIIIAVKALQGTIRLVAINFSFGGYETLTNHEDPLFISDLFILLVAFLTLRVKIPLRSALLWLLPILFLGFYAGQRRAVYLAFFISLVLFLILLKGPERYTFFRTALPFLFVVMCYTAVFWNSSSRFAEPVQLIKSGFSDSEKGAGERYYSNLYREFERYDIAATVKSFPLAGIGFGKRYLQPVDLSLIGADWSLRDWIPHSEILWLMANMGAAGFFFFVLFMNSMAFEAGRLTKALHDPFLRSIAFMIAAAVLSQIVVSYLDLQLTYYRNMVFLGTVCGLLPAISALDKKTKPEGESTKIS